MDLNISVYAYLRSTGAVLETESSNRALAEYDRRWKRGRLMDMFAGNFTVSSRSEVAKRGFGS